MYIRHQIIQIRHQVNKVNIKRAYYHDIVYMYICQLPQVGASLQPFNLRLNKHFKLAPRQRSV